jgi:hypothetical protein
MSETRLSLKKPSLRLRFFAVSSFLLGGMLNSIPLPSPAAQIVMKTGDSPLYVIQ